VSEVVEFLSYYFHVNYLIISPGKGHKELVEYSYYRTVHHCENAEMTPELCDGLAKISFDNLQDVINTINNNPGRFPDKPHTFLPYFLFRLKRLVCYKYN
jgi:hypothetical protein